MNILNMINPFKKSAQKANEGKGGNEVETSKTTVKEQVMNNSTNNTNAMNEFENIFTGKDLLNPQSENATNPDLIEEFLRKDHYSEGFHAGFNQHCVDFLDTGLSLIRSEFIECADKVHTIKTRELQAIKQSLIELGDVMPARKQVLELQVEKLEEKLKELDQQKALAVDNDGRVSVALKSFQLGFERGFTKYLATHNQTN